MTTLDKIEQVLLKGAESRAEAVSTMKDLLSSISRCQQSLRDLRSDVEDFHNNCNGAKVVGTTLSVGGGILTAASLVGALFTGGATLLVAAGVAGTISSASGAAVNITTAIVDMVKSKGYVERLESLTSDTKRQSERIQRLLKDYQESVDFIEKQLHLNDKASWMVINQFWAKFEKMGHNVKNNLDRMSGVGILFGTLFMLLPSCSADVGGMVILAHQFSPVAFDLAQRTGVELTPIVLQSLGKTTIKTGLEGAAKVGVQEVVKETEQIALQTVEKELTKEAIKTSEKLAIQVTAKVLQVVGASVSIGFVVWDIKSLISSLETGHVVVNSINTVLESLVKIKTDIEKQLKVLTDVIAQVDVQVDVQANAQVEVLTDVQTDVQPDNDDESDDSSSSSSDEEEAGIRVYDISPQFLKTLLPTRNISVTTQNWTEESAIAVIKKITEVRSVHGLMGLLNMRFPQPTQIFLSSYLKMIDALEFLICRGARFERDGDPSVITLVFSNESISFTREIRKAFRAMLLPFFECMKLHVQPGKFTCIYRFRCDLCAGQSLEFDYVGQARKFDVRYRTHQSRIRQIRENIFEGPDMDLYIDYLEWSNISRLYAHEATRHSALRLNPMTRREIFSAYVTHRLPDHGGNNPTDSSVRRSWEVFYQWFYRAMVTEGGGSQR